MTELSGEQYEMQYLFLLSYFYPSDPDYGAYSASTNLLLFSTHIITHIGR